MISVKYITPSDSKRLFSALLGNDQIYETYSYGVQNFYNKLFKIHYHLLDRSDLEKMKSKFKLYYSNN